MQSNYAVASGGYKNSSNNALPSGGKIVKSEDNSTKDDLKWEIVKEPYTYVNPFSKAETLAYSISFKRSDGLTIENAGFDREFGETFLVKGAFGEFKFYAYRVEPREPKPDNSSETVFNISERKWTLLDKYIIHVESSKGEDRKLLLTYAKDVESALLHYHIHVFDNIPVKEVVFRLGSFDNARYVHASDISKENIYQ